MLRVQAALAVAVGLGGFLAGPRPVRGDELWSPRALAHAGASLVADDGALATFVCPAAIARRGGLRVQLAAVVTDDSVWLDGDEHPQVRDLDGAARVPLLGLQWGGERLVLGAALAATSVAHRLPSPTLDLSDLDISADFPHRYAGVEASWSQTVLAVAAAVRVTDWLALGASATIARVTARESRWVWAGFAERDAAGDPARDLAVSLDGSDDLVPGGAIGALFAPTTVPIELAFGAAWSDDVRLTGAAAATGLRSPVTIALDSPTAAARFGAPLVIAAGARWLAERWSAEVGAELRRHPTDRDPWTIRGIEVIDESRGAAPIAALEGRFARADQETLRGAAEAEVLPAFLWVAAGWSWTRAESGAEVTTVGFDPGGHTLGLGIELFADAATVTVGVARQLTTTAEVDDSALRYDNPFEPGTEPVNLGSHHRRRTAIGFGVELSWD